MNFLLTISASLLVCLFICQTVSSNEALRHSVHDFIDGSMFAGNMGIKLNGEHCVDCDDHKPETLRHDTFDEKLELSQFLERMIANEAIELTLKPNKTLDMVDSLVTEAKKHVKEEKEKKKKEKITFANL